jgi:hypothetical protein
LSISAYSNDKKQMINLQDNNACIAVYQWSTRRY